MDYASLSLSILPLFLWTCSQKRKASCILTVGTGPRLGEEILYFFLRTTPLCILPDYLSLQVMYTFSRGLYHPSEKLLAIPPSKLPSVFAKEILPAVDHASQWATLSLSLGSPQKANDYAPSWTIPSSL